MSILEVKDEISEKLNNHLKFNDKNIPLTLEVKIVPEELENILIWLKGKLYILEETNNIIDNNFKKLYFRFQLVNNLPMGWKIIYSNQQL